MTATSKGKRWHEELTPRVMTAVDEALAALAEPERRALRGLLQQVLGEAS